MSTSSFVGSGTAASDQSTAQQPGGSDRPRPARRRFRIDRYALIIAFALLVLGFGLYEPSTFMSVGNLSNILGSQAVLFVLVLAAIPSTLMGDFVDLSLGAVLGMSAMTTAVMNVQNGVSIVPACLIGIAVAAFIGLVNAYFVVWYQANPFIVTLGTMTVVTGIIYVFSGNNSIGVVSVGLSNWVFTNNFLSIPLEFYYGLAIFLLVWYVLSFTPIGQKMLVTGQSREVARLSGVKVDKMRAWSFLLGAVIAGIAGVLYAGTNGTVDPTAGSTLILPAFAAVFLGATAIRPGRFNPLGSFIAVYFLATGTAGFQLAGAQSYVQQVFYGVALVAALTLPRMNREKFLLRVLRRRSAPAA